MPTRRRHSTNDLFEIFPDLPWTRHRKKKEQLQRKMDAMRDRDQVSTVRQHTATERVLAALAGSWRRK